MVHDCPDIEELSAYRDGEMSSADALAMDDHVLGCVACRDTLRKLHLLHGAAVEEQAPAPDLLPAIMEQVDCHRHASDAGMGWRRWSPVPLALAAGVMLTIGVLLGQSLVQRPVGSTDPLMEQMRVFEVIPPGGLCADLDACFEVHDR